MPVTLESEDFVVMTLSGLIEASEANMKKVILAVFLILALCLPVFAGETVRVYDSKHQLKYIYDVEKGRGYDTKYQLRYIVKDDHIYDYKYQPKYIYDAKKGRIYTIDYSLKYEIKNDRVYNTKYYPVYYLQRK